MNWPQFFAVQAGLWLAFGLDRFITGQWWWRRNRRPPW